MNASNERSSVNLFTFLGESEVNALHALRALRSFSLVCQVCQISIENTNGNENGNEIQVGKIYIYDSSANFFFVFSFKFFFTINIITNNTLFKQQVSPHVFENKPGVKALSVE